MNILLKLSPKILTHRKRDKNPQDKDPVWSMDFLLPPKLQGFLWGLQGGKQQVMIALPRFTPHPIPQSCLQGPLFLWLFSELKASLTWLTSISAAFTFQWAKSSPTLAHFFPITFLESQSRASLKQSLLLLQPKVFCFIAPALIKTHTQNNPDLCCGILPTQSLKNPHTTGQPAADTLHASPTW